MVLLENGKIISLSVRKGENYDKIEKLIEQSADFVKGTRTTLPDPVHFEGQIRKMNSKVEDYFRLALIMNDLSPKSDAYCLEINADEQWSVHLIFFIISIGMAEL